MPKLTPYEDLVHVHTYVLYIVLTQVAASSSYQFNTQNTRVYDTKEATVRRYLSRDVVGSLST